MASNPLFCIFPMNFAMATLGLKEMGKFLWEGREKGLPCWLSQFSLENTIKSGTVKLGNKELSGCPKIIP